MRTLTGVVTSAVFSVTGDACLEDFDGCGTSAVFSVTGDACREDFDGCGDIGRVFCYR